MTARLRFFVFTKWSALALLLALVLFAPLAAFAATPTPIPPTETLVPLFIPINPLMVSTNSWLQTFAPIVSIGLGIGLALAVLGYVGNMIRSAFR